MNSILTDKPTLRKQLRAARRALSYDQQLEASWALIETVKPLLKRNRVKRVAMYLAMDGEIDLQPLMHFCEQRRVEVYLPVIHPFHPTLWFAKHEPGAPMYENRFRIPEPLHGDPVAPWQLNWVLFPLVGFDPQGGRLGMGGGFYDRTFSHAERWPRKPTLLGVAHQCQKVDALPVDSWDIRLDGVITDQAHYPA